MAADENLFKWNEFLNIGATINKQKGMVCIQSAKVALNFSKDLLDNRYITDCIERYKLYRALVPKIAEYLDENGERIKGAVRDYFLFRHGKSGLDENLFDITFHPKKSGIQTGFSCDVNNGKDTTCYYIKTHQYGPTENTVNSARPPDIKEIFIYKLLEHIGIGPESYFIFPFDGSKRNVLIVTKEIKLTLLSDLNNRIVNYAALLEIDLISRILSLRDCGSNGSNCGQINGNPMIVDFRIKKKAAGYVKAGILDGFCNGNDEFNYTGLMEIATQLPSCEKLNVLKNLLAKWNLMHKIEISKIEVDEIVLKAGNKVEFQNDLVRFVADININTKSLMDYA